MTKLREGLEPKEPCLPLASVNIWRRLRIRLTLLAWRSLWFRSAAYLSFLVLGRLFRSLSVALAWFWPGFVVVFLVFVAWNLSEQCSGPCTIDAIRKTVSIRYAIEALVIYALLWTGVAAFLSRRKIVVLETLNRAGDEFSNLAKGLSPEILARLNDLKELHSSRDAARRPDAPVAPPIVRFDPTGNLPLAEIVGEKSSMKMSGFEIPLGPIVRLLQGPFIPPTRLSSSVQWQDGALTLFASIDSEGRIWRADQPLAAGATSAEKASAFGKAREELVFRVFTDMSSIESSEWTAVAEFSKGLQAYRQTLISDVDRVFNLRKAEGFFFEALSHDKNFARCGYNLGVVYRELEASYNHGGDSDPVGVRSFDECDRQTGPSRQYRQSAIACFMQSLDDNPKDVDAAYALAVICREKDRNYGKSVEFADRVIAEMSTHAQAWNVRGDVLRLMSAAPDSKEAWQSVLRSRELAAGLAWRDLCRAAGSGEADLIETAKEDIVAPFANLATALDKLGRNRRSEKILRQGIYKNRDQRLHFALANNLTQRRRYRDAVVQFKHAVSSAQTLEERARYYAGIANVARHEKPFVRQAFGDNFDLLAESLTSPSSTDNETRVMLARAFPEKSDSIALIGRVLDALKPDAPAADLPTACAKKPTRLQRIECERLRLKSLHNDPLRRWAKAILDIEHANLLILEQAREAPPKAQMDREKYRRDLVASMKRGIDSLQQEFPAEDLLRQAYERLAEAFRGEDRFKEAQAYAELAVAQGPFAASASRELGLVHFSSAEFDRSEQELKRSFGLDPFSSDTLRQIGQLSQKRADIAATRNDRTEEFKKAIDKYQQALSLGDEKTDRGFLHHWLGRYYGGILEYETGRKHYAIAIANQRYVLESSFYAGWTAFEQEHYPSAEGFFRETLRIMIREWQEEDGPRKKAAFRDFLRLSGDPSLTGLDETRGYIALRIGVFMGAIVAERYHSYGRGRRILKIVLKNMDVLGETKTNRTSKMLDRLRDKRKELEALCKSYLGWISFLDEAHQDARKYLEESLKIREMPETLCHLAWLDLAYGRTDKVRRHCAQARQIDIRGWCESRIAQIEEASKAEPRRGAAG
jgi:tetratricopeptide (TPR) repeat protein